MSWNPHFFNRLSEKEESACKEVYYKYYVKIYVYVLCLIPDRNYAENITLHTLLQICNNGNLPDEVTLLAFARRIATNKCLEFFSKEPGLKKYFEEYLANDGNSEQLLEAAFNNAMLMEKRLKKWKQLSSAEQEETIAVYKSLFTSGNSLDTRYSWPDLLNKYREGDISESELSELFQQVKLSKVKQAQLDQFATNEGIMDQLLELDYIDPARGYESFKKQLHVIRQPEVYHFRIMVAAVFIYIVMAIGHNTFSLRPVYQIPRKPPFSIRDLDAGKEPVLVLHNGSVIKLDSVPDGVFIAPGVPFMKMSSTLIHVQSELEGPVQAHGINILSVPPDRQYQITLADSSVIMVSASSQLHFPFNFSNNERWVAIKGQAYFQVKANPSKPFFVNVNDQLCAKAIGTAFNIETNKESDFIKTTLVEGHLAVTEYSSKKSQSLQAGQQASFNNGSFIIYDTLDLQQITAWTRGEFNFNENSIYEIMEKIGLWYNVKIKYEGEMPTKSFSLNFLKLVPLSEAAAIISKGLQLNVKPVADTLIVSPGN